jgi:hypothetical protein
LVGLLKGNARERVDDVGLKECNRRKLTLTKTCVVTREERVVNFEGRSGYAKNCGEGIVHV